MVFFGEGVEGAEKKLEDYLNGLVQEVGGRTVLFRREWLLEGSRGVYSGLVPRPYPRGRGWTG
jgi:hypothetical protein